MQKAEPEGDKQVSELQSRATDYLLERRVWIKEGQKLRLSVCRGSVRGNKGIRVSAIKDRVPSKDIKQMIW